MDPPSGFGLGPFHAGGISAQLKLGLLLIFFGFFVLALLLLHWKKKRVTDFSTYRVIAVKARAIGRLLGFLLTCCL